MPMICKVCRNALSLHINVESGASWHHEFVDQALDFDHAVEPIDAPDDWRGRCDFCTAGVPEFVLPVRAFSFPDMPERMSSEDWAACAQCAELLDRNSWNGILRRAMISHEIRHGVPLSSDQVQLLSAMYRKLRKNVTGSLRRIDE